MTKNDYLQKLWATVSQGWHEDEKANMLFNFDYNSTEYKGVFGLKNYVDWQVHYNEEDNTVYVLFQKTGGTRDWFTNFAFTKKYYDSFDTAFGKITLRVHHGWANQYKAVKHLIRNAVSDIVDYKNVTKVVVTGWSLGSSLAQLCAQDLRYNFGDKITISLYTFGSVNPFRTNIFNRKKTLQYLRSCCNDIGVYKDINDMVAYVVPTWMGFRAIYENWVSYEADKKVTLKRFFEPMTYHTHYGKTQLIDDIIVSKREKNERY